MSNSSSPETPIEIPSCRAAAMAHSTCFMVSFTASPYPRSTSCVVLKSNCLLMSGLPASAARRPPAWIIR
jgi:hypothetical protein